ncbi:hypothetical protein F5B20DRAFT_596864 [Whalleya microplaca]|nr:hypothetical protein F5B20DRAFT_596864 [Whalleya microplaca]
MAKRPVLCEEEILILNTIITIIFKSVSTLERERQLEAIMSSNTSNAPPPRSWAQVAVAEPPRPPTPPPRPQPQPKKSILKPVSPSRSPSPLTLGPSHFETATEAKAEGEASSSPPAPASGVKRKPTWDAVVARDAETGEAVPNSGRSGQEYRAIYRRARVEAQLQTCRAREEEDRQQYMYRKCKKGVEISRLEFIEGGGEMDWEFSSR